jgi:hypothetical protein
MFEFIIVSVCMGLGFAAVCVYRERQRSIMELHQDVEMDYLGYSVDTFGGEII